MHKNETILLSVTEEEGVIVATFMVNNTQFCRLTCNVASYIDWGWRFDIEYLIIDTQFFI